MADIAKLMVVFTDMSTIFEGDQVSIATLTGLREQKKFAEFLDLCESYGESMAFLDHQALMDQLVKGWTIMIDVLKAEGKSLTRKLTALREDKKTDPAVLAKAEGNMEDFYGRRAIANANMVRLDAMARIQLDEFKTMDVDAACKKFYEEKGTRY